MNFTPAPRLYSINGIADAPGRWVDVLEAATLRRGLSDLTLLTFADLFSESHLFRNVSAWCPSCFESRRRHGIPYESLLWTIETVKVCPFHRQPLEDICPHCRRRSRPLGAHARPGYCCRCGGWLGGARGPVEKSINDSDLEREIWITQSIGDLLAAAPNLKSSPLRQRLRINLSTCVDAATGGNLLAFAAITRTSRSALRYWVSGVHRPEIGALLRMCYATGVPTIQLLVCSYDPLLIRWAQRARHQAETPPTAPSKFPGPALFPGLEISRSCVVVYVPSCRAGNIGCRCCPRYPCRARRLPDHSGSARLQLLSSAH